MSRTFVTWTSYVENWYKMASSTHPHWMQAYINSGKTLEVFLWDKWQRYCKRYPIKLKRFPKKVVIEHARAMNTKKNARKMAWLDSGPYTVTKGLTSPTK